MNKFICLFLFALPLIGKAQNTHIIYASDYNIFSPSELTIQVNDTVYFENLTSHNAVEVDEETYNNNGTTSNVAFRFKMMVMLYLMKQAPTIIFVHHMP